ncbi:MAG: serine/threonine-protein kinase [Gemmatimonadetes bacterium]|nr:serine/threonine-protein kinase [Gemmatimonadota bacterium]
MNRDLERLSAAIADRYRVERELGQGGMATVYLAHDLKHERDVAIKVLHPDLGAALGGERFLSEIRTTARLQHPHILPLLDSGDAGEGLLYYVMPLVTGETLRARLTRARQLPIPEAIRIAREVAGALDYAHRQGVIHRDIKPENILLHDGSALVADFGIALAVQSAGGQRMTQTGLSLGTPQYMSPEQAMGERTIDARTDIYALGAVTYEMLAGDPPFTGSSVQAIVAKVLNERPTPLATLRDTCPAGVEAAVLTALAKLPADRFESVKAFGDALQDGRSGPHASAGGARSGMVAAPMRVSRLPLAAMGVVTLASLLVAAWALRASRTAADAPVVQLTLEPPNARPDLARFAVSGDGARFAFSTDEGIVYRDAGQREYRVLTGTTAGESPSFSPDGEWIVYETNGRLRKVPVSGGTPLALISGDSVRAGRVNWGEDGTIVFETGSRIGLLTPAGALRVLTKARDAQEPRMTPDGKGVLYVDNHAGAKLMYYDLALDSTFTLVEEAAEGTLVPAGFLVYGSTAGGLYAVRFNQARHAVEGTPTPVVLDIQPNGGVAPFAITRSGMLVYRAGVDAEHRVLIRDAQGRVDTLPMAPKVLSYARFSPDGTQLALTIGSARGTNRHVALYNFETHAFTRFTTDGGGHSPVWSPDGKQLAFTAETPETDAEDVFVQPVDRSAPARRMPRLPNDQHANDWPNDTTLVFSNNMAARTLGGKVGGGSTSLVNPLTATGVRSYLEAPWGEFAAIVSPDGKWAAFTSLQSGKSEIHVKPFPLATAGAEVTVAADGQQARWSGDGRTIYYETADFTQVRATHVTPGPTFTVGATETLLTRPTLGVAWDVDKKTGRMVLTEPVTAAGVRLVVMQQWLDGFLRKVADRK